jgi:hypothetical protein
MVGPTILAGAALLASGASTKSISTWAAPDAGQLRFAGQKVAAVVLTAHPESRHGSEDYLAFELKKRGVASVQAYSLVPESQTKNREAAKAAFDKAGMVGVVVLRVVGSDQELTATPSTWVGVSYSSFWGGYYDYGMAYTYVPVPGYIMNDTVLTIETLVYDLRRDKLVFAARNRAKNPQRVDTLVKELVDKAVKDMQKQGLVGAGK